MSALKFLRTAAAVAALVLVAGCQMKTQVKADIDTQDEVAAATFAARHEALEHPYWEVVDGLWLGGDAIALVNDEPEHPALGLDVTLKRQVPMTLPQVAEFISSTAGVPVHVAQDALLAAETAAATDAFVSLTADPGTAATPTRGAFHVSYQGPLEGLLDYVAARTGNAWEQDGRGFVIFHRTTRTYAVDGLPTKPSVSTRVSNLSAGGEGEGGSGAGGIKAESGQTTTMAVEVDLFSAIADTVKAMLGTGDTATVSPPTQSVTVTATPIVLARVADYVATMNKRIGRQVHFDVRVLSVDLNDSESYGINWSLVYNNLRSVGITSDTFSSGADDANTLGVTVLDPTSRLNNSELLLEALSQQGRVSTVTTSTAVTVSGSPAPVQISRQASYLARVETTVSGVTGVTQTTIEPGTVTTGYTSTVLPVVTEAGEVLVQLQVQLSALRRLNNIGVANVGVGGSQQLIQAPEVDSRDILQVVKVKSGATLVLSGFEQTGLSTDERGIGDASFSLAGGGADTTAMKSRLVVLMTARVVN